MRDLTAKYPYIEPPCCQEFEELCITKEIDQMSGTWTLYTTNNDNYGVRYQRIHFCPFCGESKTQTQKEA